VKQIVGTDVTATNGTTFVFASGLAANDVVEYVAYGTFSLSDHYNKTTSDARYAQLSGANFTGDITTTGKMLFSNVYSQLSDLPSAATYHGGFVHVHATGKAYYAHNSAWVPLVNEDGSGGVKLGSNWTVTESGGSLYFSTGGTNKMKLDASGNLDVVGNVNSNATIS